MSASRRSADSTTPVGHWCAGVTTTALAPLAAERVDVDPVLVDRDGDGLKPGTSDDHAVLHRARVLSATTEIHVVGNAPAARRSARSGSPGTRRAECSIDARRPYPPEVGGERPRAIAGCPARARRQDRSRSPNESPRPTPTTNRASGTRRVGDAVLEVDLEPSRRRRPSGVADVGPAPPPPSGRRPACPCPTRGSGSPPTPAGRSSQRPHHVRRRAAGPASGLTGAARHAPGGPPGWRRGARAGAERSTGHRCGDRSPPAPRGRVPSTPPPCRQYSPPQRPTRLSPNPSGSLLSDTSDSASGAAREQRPRTRGCDDCTDR